MNGYVDFNQLFNQMNPSYGVQQGLNNMLWNGYSNFGNQMQGAMNQMYAINDANANRNVINNQTEAQYQAARVPIEVAQTNANAETNRLQTLSPLLEKLFGSIGGMFGGSGSDGGGVGFKALDAQGNPFASATLGGSDAKATDLNRYKRNRLAA